MGNRLASRNTAVPFTNMAKLTTVASRSTATKRHWHYNGTRLLGSTSGIRLDYARMPGTTIRNDNFLKELRSGIGKSTKNVFRFQPGWFYELAKNNGNFISQGRLVGFGFGENGTDETRRKINKVALNMSATVLTTIGLLVGFATFSRVSAATNPKHETSPEDEDSHYSQESSERMDCKEFHYRGGIAVRDEDFPYVWTPKRDNPLDKIAAHEAARCEAETKAYSLSKKLFPPVIGVLQGANGEAMGNHSIRGTCAQEKFRAKEGNGGKMYQEQRDILDSIPEEERGDGHGFCAEQVFTHNMEVIRKRQQNYPEANRMFEGPCFVIAYLRNRETGKYDIPINACKSCQITNRCYNFEDLIICVMTFQNMYSRSNNEVGSVQFSSSSLTLLNIYYFLEIFFTAVAICLFLYLWCETNKKYFWRF